MLEGAMPVFLFLARAGFKSKCGERFSLLGFLLFCWYHYC